MHGNVELTSRKKQFLRILTDFQGSVFELRTVWREERLQSAKKRPRTSGGGGGQRWEQWPCEQPAHEPEHPQQPPFLRSRRILRTARSRHRATAAVKSQSMGFMTGISFPAVSPTAGCPPDIRRRRTPRRWHTASGPRIRPPIRSAFPA